MSLISCPECAREVSESARTCPGCGHFVEWPRRAGIIKRVILLGIANVVIASAALVTWRALSS